MNKKLLILGATGFVGRSTLRRALREESLEITVLVRTPSKLPEEVKDKIRIIEGNALQEDDVNGAMEGQEAVISCLGPKPVGDGANGIIFSKGMEIIIEAMRLHNVKYLTFVGASLLLPGASKAWSSLFAVVKDGQTMTEYLEKEVDDIMWTTAMPFNISRSGFTGNYQLELGKSPGTFHYSVTHEDLADWLVKTVIDQSKMEEHNHKMYGISSGSSCSIM